MARTTVTAVRQTMATALTTPQLQAFVDDAAAWVTEILVPASTASDALLEILERYLACALVRCRELGVKSTSLGDVSENYQADAELSDYLHRAAALDPTGLIRQNFLAPRPLAAPVTTGLVFRVGKGFAADSTEAESS